MPKEKEVSWQELERAFKVVVENVVPDFKSIYALSLSTEKDTGKVLHCIIVETKQHFDILGFDPPKSKMVTFKTRSWLSKKKMSELGREAMEEILEKAKESGISIFDSNLVILEKGTTAEILTMKADLLEIEKKREEK